MPVISADFVKSSSKHWNCRASETPGCFRAARATNSKVYWQSRSESDQPGRGQDAAVAAAYDFGGIGTVVDVGGGQGGLLSAILAANPRARGVLFDLPHVAAMAQQHLESAGLSNRSRTEAGDFFKKVPPGLDLYLLRKVIHDWDDESARRILRTCREALAGSARLGTP